MNWFFLLGLLAPIPVWVLTRTFPNVKWLRLINVPILLGATGAMPPARSVNYICWGAVGLFFNFVVYSAWD
ncbi:Oligopeptide transporter 2 [Acorus calamus]|uniref:Oligopeptide transporter 2 n=1 Tax=Acorus calamus TaxID=4465 RepID=A0AAV9CTB9_ACOCL|nr:Oligopeptide transporter 2 [Acorus calamus]